MATLPHEREKIFLDDIIDDCLKGRDKLVVVVSDNYHHMSYFAEQSRRIAEGLEPDLAKQIRIYREALEFDNGAKILFQYQSSPNNLRGLRPDRIVIMGPDAEFWYLVLGCIKNGATVEAVA